MAFKDLDDEALYRTAVEDFAVDVKPEDNRDTILAALKEDGVTWKMYQKAHPETAVGEDTDSVDEAGKEKKDSKVKPKVRTRSEPVDVSTTDSYLIKMDRDNPYFEHRGYKFTQDHPYVVMPAEDADDILRREEGFSIATPSEANEFYQHSK